MAERARARRPVGPVERHAGSTPLDPAGTHLPALDEAFPGGARLRVEIVRPPPARDDDLATAFAVDLVLGPPGAGGGRNVRIDVSCRADRPVEATVRLRVDLPGVADPWWLVPGLFYGENRPAGSDRPYPRFTPDRRPAGDEDIAAGRPAGEASDPLTSSWWEFRADRAATPGVFVWGDASDDDGGHGREPGGIALLTTETSAVGQTGVGFAHERGTAGVWLSFPFREAPVMYYGSAQTRPPVLAGHRWQPGERLILEARLHPLSVDRHAFAPILREVAERARTTDPVEPWVDVAEAADIAAEGLLRWHYEPDPGVLLETVGFDRGIAGQDGKPVDRQAMHVGWVSGIPWAYALLAHGLRTGRADEVDAARRVIDFVCAELSPSGTFWGVWYRGRGWRQSWSPVADGLHARTLGEATLFLLRALGLPADDADRNTRWTAAARSNLDVLADRQRPDGNLGAVHSAQSGQVLSWAGAAGLTWVAAFAEAQALDDDGRYLAAARRAGEYYARFVEAEFIHGAPEDVGLAPTSEDGYAAVMAYVALHRRTGEARWLDLARRAADWMLTFRYTYNVDFAPRTLLGAYRFASRGADQASPSNQHLHAYGLVCTAEMAELAAALDDPYYAERAAESLACFRQLLPVHDGDVNAYRGMVTERYYQTECFQPKGMVLTLSHAWSAGVLLLACEQVLGGAHGSPA